MAHLPKKGDQVRCIISHDGDNFSHGCLYDVEKVSKANRLVYVYGDSGNMVEIDYPEDMRFGRFEIND